MEDEQIVKDGVDDAEVTEDDLRDLKYGSDEVETSNEEDESNESNENEESEDGEEDGQTDDQTEESQDSTFVKEFPQIKGDTPEEYAKNLEAAYGQSFAELKRIRDDKQPKDNEKTAPIDTSNITDLYVKSEMDERIRVAFADFSKKYPQVSDASEYDKFVNEVKVQSNTILESQGRLATPAELYRRAAIMLDWESTAPTSEEKLKSTVKENSSSSKTTSSTKKASTSKVTEAMIIANRKMYPDKTDAQIREELEPYIQ